MTLYKKAASLGIVAVIRFLSKLLLTLGAAGCAGCSWHGSVSVSLNGIRLVAPISGDVIEGTLKESVSANTSTNDVTSCSD